MHLKQKLTFSVQGCTIVHREHVHMLLLPYVSQINIETKTYTVVNLLGVLHLHEYIMFQYIHLQVPLV